MIRSSDLDLGETHWFVKRVEVAVHHFDGEGDDIVGRGVGAAAGAERGGVVGHVTEEGEGGREEDGKG